MPKWGVGGRGRGESVWEALRANGRSRRKMKKVSWEKKIFKYEIYNI